MSHASHSEKHFTSKEVIRDIILGMSDGLTVPFALAAGLSSAGSHMELIMVAGLAEIAAGSISMGLGGFLAAKNEAEHYASEEKREHEEIATVPEKEIEETVEIFKPYGLSERHLGQVIEQFRKNPDHWVEFMMRHELQLEKPNPGRARTSALTIAVAYLVGGAIPLSPYFFMHSPTAALIASVTVTISALLIFGYVKAKFIGANPFKGMVQTALIGGVAAAIAFLIAKFFA